MALAKVTFTLDADTVARLRSTAAKLGKPQSQVVREAVVEYAARAGRLSDAERTRLLAVFDRVVPTIPARPAAAVDRELKAVRISRRSGGRGRTTR